jgi:N6-adenosine-specific RNA methylase IME4
MKFDIIVADPAWNFSDSLTMTDVKRGASSQYDTLSTKDIINLPVKEISADNSVLALWVPSSLLQEGLDTMKNWGFKQTQTHIWVKIKNNPFEHFIKLFMSLLKKINIFTLNKEDIANIVNEFENFDYDQLLAFGMGRLFRQTHEICLLGVRGKIYDSLKNKSQRSVHFDTNKKHSAKPEILQDRLELMFPNAVNKIELFARRTRNGWFCAGNQCPGTIDEDIRDTIGRLSKLP